jgi:hypothetical protein
MCRRVVLFLAFLMASSGAFAEPRADRRTAFQPSATSPRLMIIEKQGETPFVREVLVFAADGKTVLLRQEVYADNAGSVVKVSDLNGDGFFDLLLWDAHSGVRNDIYTVYLFDGSKNAFVEAQVRKPDNTESGFMTRPSWDTKAGALHERHHIGRAGSEFAEYCSRWEGAVLSAYLVIDSTGIKPKREDDEWRFRLTLTRVGAKGRETRKLVATHETLTQHYLSEKSRKAPCAMWERTFNSLKK